MVYLLGICLETPVFWLGLYITFDQNLINGVGSKKNVLFKKKNNCGWGSLFQTQE